jgi:hypothetical protein
MGGRRDTSRGGLRGRVQGGVGAMMKLLKGVEKAVIF